MSTETTLPDQGEVASPGLTEEQAVQEILGRWQKTEEPPKEEAQQTPEPEQPQGDAQTEEEPEAEAEEEEADTEIDIAGEKFKVPAKLSETAKRIEAKAKEVEAGATKRFQEAADLRKAAEAERASVAQLRKVAEANADLIADHKMIARRLAQLEAVDINSTDTDTLTRLNAEYSQLQAAKTRVEQAYQQNVQRMNKAEKDAFRAKQEQAEKVVSQRIKDWGPEKQKALAEYAVARGAPAATLAQITEPWMVEILDDAAYGRQMREHKAKPLDKRVVTTQATLKPGASAAQPRAAARAEEAMSRLKKSGSASDAAMALLARSNVRNR